MSNMNDVLRNCQQMQRYAEPFRLEQHLGGGL